MPLYITTGIKLLQYKDNISDHGTVLVLWMTLPQFGFHTWLDNIDPVINSHIKKTKSIFFLILFPLKGHFKDKMM